MIKVSVQEELTVNEGYFATEVEALAWVEKGKTQGWISKDAVITTADVEDPAIGRDREAAKTQQIKKKLKDLFEKPDLTDAEIKEGLKLCFNYIRIQMR